MAMNYGIPDYSYNPEGGIFGTALQGLSNAGQSTLAREAANASQGLTSANQLGGYSGGGFMGNVNTGGLAQGGGGGSIWDSMLGGEGEQGWGSLALGVAQGAFGAYNSMKTYGLAQDQLAESKRQFNANYNTQKSLLNTQMSDRQSARVASNPDAYQSVGDYMSKNGV